MTTKEVRAKILETMGGKCERCGHADQEVLQLHHRDKQSKHPDYKNILRWSWEEIEQEIAGCELLCANCHWKEHTKRNPESLGIKSRGKRGEEAIPQVFSGHPTDILNGERVAEILGCRPEAISPLCESGELKGKRLGHGGWRITRQVVIDYLEGKK